MDFCLSGHPINNFNLCLEYYFSSQQGKKYVSHPMNGNRGFQQQQKARTAPILQHITLCSLDNTFQFQSLKPIIRRIWSKYCPVELRYLDNLNIFKLKQFILRCFPREHFHFRIIKLGVKCQNKHFSHSRYLGLVFEQF